MQVIDIAPWLCWILPIIGALAALALNKVNRKAMNLTVIATALLSWVMTLLLIPNLFNYNSVDNSLFWFSIAGGQVGVGLLIDPLSIIIVNVVAFLGFLIMVYSSKYMAETPTRA